MNKFEKNLEAFFWECREVALVENLQSNVEYRKLMKECGDLMDEIIKKLGEDNKALVFRLEETQNQKVSIDIQSIYEQGKADCIALLKHLQVL